MILSIVKRLIGIFLIYIFSFVLWTAISHENSVDKKFGETQYCEDEKGNLVPENLEREFRRQDEDMATLVSGILSLIIIILSVIFFIKG